MSCGPRRRSVPLTIPLKSFPSEQDVVGEVSVCWMWGIHWKLFEILSDLHEAETKGHFPLYRDSCFLTSLQSRAMHSEVNYLEQNKWEIQGKGRKKKKISKLLLMLLVLSMYLTRLEVTGCHWDGVVRLQPGTLPQGCSASLASPFIWHCYVRSSGFNTHLQWWILPGRWAVALQLFWYLFVWLANSR